MDRLFCMKEPLLTKEQLDTFATDGVLVVENILTPTELDSAKEGLYEVLNSHGVNPHDLTNTGRNLMNLSSTNGSGGVLDVFYTPFQLKIACHERLFQVTKELWKMEYAVDDKGEGSTRVHPFGEFNVEEGFVYLDRIGYRIPTKMAEEIARQQVEKETTTTLSQTCKKKKKIQPIQRSLTPHLDCCPTTYHSTHKDKWRPIQCFVSLTDNLHPNTGGFEAAPGFHLEFDQWRHSRPDTILTKRDARTGVKTKVSIPPPCMGEYTHIRPVQDQSVLDRVRHVSVRAGSAVFWDQRIPHANSYRHDGEEARAVVYCSFLPNVEVNRRYVKRQLEGFRRGKVPTDQWIEPKGGGKDEDDSVKEMSCEYEFSALGKKLMGMEPW